MLVGALLERLYMPKSMGPLSSGLPCDGSDVECGGDRVRDLPIILRRPNNIEFEARRCIL